MRRRVALLLLLGLVVTSCTGKADTSQLTPQGHRDYDRLQIAQVLGDAIEAAVTANGIGKLSDTATARTLGIFKQVNDYVKADPRGTKAQALVIIRNARQALPPALNDEIAEYLTTLIAFLGGLPQ